MIYLLLLERVTGFTRAFSHPGEKAPPMFWRLNRG
jgi:hypothetical protein